MSLMLNKEVLWRLKDQGVRLQIGSIRCSRVKKAMLNSCVQSHWVLSDWRVSSGISFGKAIKKKWKKLSGSLKVGDSYEGVLTQDGLRLKVPALKDVLVGFALADKTAEERMADSATATLRACWGMEEKLETALSLAHKEGLELRRDVSVYSPQPWQLAGGVMPKTKMRTVPTRENLVKLVISDFVKEARPVNLKVAYVDDNKRAVFFSCEALERLFFNRVEYYLKGVELATKAHAAVIAQKTFKGEIVRVPGEKNVIEVRLDGVDMHRVFLAEPAWDFKTQFACLSTGSFDDYICENWLTTHEFILKEHDGPCLIVRSATINKALGIDEAKAEKIAFLEDSLVPNANYEKPKSRTGKVVPRIIVDASNVVCTDEKSSWRALRALLCAFEKRGQDFIVMFDANIYHVLEKKGEAAGVNYIKSLEEKYKDSVRLVPAGNRADEYILLIADQTGNHILSRDRYQDPQYMKRYPWLIIEDQNEIDSRRLHKFAVFDSHVTVPDLGLFEKIDYGD